MAENLNPIRPISLLRCLLLIAALLAAQAMFAESEADVPARNPEATTPALQAQAPETHAQPPLAELSVPQLIVRGNQLRSSKAYAQALVYYRMAVDKAPGDSMSWNLMGIAHLQLGDYYVAKSNFEAAIQLRQGYAEAHNNLGTALYCLRDFRGAAKHYREAISLDDGNPLYHNNLAAACFSQRKYRQATEEYNRALRLSPEGVLPRSPESVHAMVASQQEQSRLAYLMAKLCAKAGNRDGALAYLRQAKEFGYRHLKDALQETEFFALRKDQQFLAMMGAN